MFNLILGLVLKHESAPELGKHIALTINRVFRANKGFFDWTATRRLGKDKSKCTPVIMTGLCSRYLFFDEIFHNNTLRRELFDFWKFRRTCYVSAIIQSLYERSVLPQPSRHLTMQLMDKILHDKRHYVQILFEKVYNPQNLPPYEMITSWHLENALETPSSKMDLLDPKKLELDKA